MKKIDQILQSQLNDIKEQGTFKEERVIETAQESEINVNGKKVLNFCANNYLGLANNSEIRAAAMQAILAPKLCPTNTKVFSGYQACIFAMI